MRRAEPLQTAHTCLGRFAWIPRVPGLHHTSTHHQKSTCWPSQASQMRQRVLHETGAWLTCITTSPRSPQGGSPSGLLLQHSIHPPDPPHSAWQLISRSGHHPGPTCKTLSKGETVSGAAWFGERHAGHSPCKSQSQTLHPHLGSPCAHSRQTECGCVSQVFNLLQQGDVTPR